MGSVSKKHVNAADRLENTILRLQDQCVATAEELEAQSEKEYFFDKEISRMSRLIEQLRPQESKPTVQQIMNATQSVFSKGGSQARSVRLKDGDQGQVNNQKQKVTGNLNEIKAKNCQLREALNSLR